MSIRLIGEICLRVTEREGNVTPVLKTIRLMIAKGNSSINYVDIERVREVDRETGDANERGRKGLAEREGEQ